MHIVLVSPNVMKQVDLDLCFFSEVDGYLHLIVCIGYFRKWSEVKPIRFVTAFLVAIFLYEIMCHHGCFKVQINDQGREFLNGVCTYFHELADTEQHMTSTYHLQSNGLVQRQNKKIKNALVILLDAHPEEWPRILEGYYFRYRVNHHFSINNSPFFNLDQKPILPIEVKFSSAERKVNETKVSHEKTFQAFLASATHICGEIHESATCNISKTQDK